jgi:hypothetical protein
MNHIFHGVLKDQSLVLLDSAVPFPDGTPMQVTPATSTAGSPAAVLAAMESEPHVTSEDVAELDHAITAGRRPLAPIDIFASEPN